MTCCVPCVSFAWRGAACASPSTWWRDSGRRRPTWASPKWRCSRPSSTRRWSTASSSSRCGTSRNRQPTSPAWPDTSPNSTRWGGDEHVAFRAEWERQTRDGTRGFDKLGSHKLEVEIHDQIRSEPTILKGWQNVQKVMQKNICQKNTNTKQKNMKKKISRHCIHITNMRWDMQNYYTGGKCRNISTAHKN